MKLLNSTRNCKVTCTVS